MVPQIAVGDTIRGADLLGAVAPHGDWAQGATLYSTSSRAKARRLAARRRGQAIGRLFLIPTASWTGVEVEEAVVRCIDRVSSRSSG